MVSKNELFVDLGLCYVFLMNACGFVLLQVTSSAWWPATTFFSAFIIMAAVFLLDKKRFEAGEKK